MSIDATVIVPIKPWRWAKSRLAVGPDARHDLARAFALDVLDVLASSEHAARLVIVTAEEGVTATAAELGAVVLPDEPSVSDDQLNDAVEQGLSWAISHAPTSPVVVVPSDLPSLTSRVFNETLDELSQWDTAFVPDISGRGTTAVWASSAQHLRTFYGPDSAKRHGDNGSTSNPYVDPRIRHDVDTMADLRAVIRLGVGWQTQRVLDRFTTGDDQLISATVR